MDSNWPRASEWLTPGESGEIALLGVPAFATSISQTQAHLTPDAIRAALARYSTYSVEWGRDLREISLVDRGNLTNPDADEDATIAAVATAVAASKMLIALGGDNSITYAVGKGSGADAVITFDAHHDVREGKSNGSPIRRLIESGLSGKKIVQIGISDFANSAHYSAWAKDQGIHVITRTAVSEMGMAAAVIEALDYLDAAKQIHVDVDVDVCDRSVAPACPASVPGGFTADELRTGVRLICRDKRVRSLDITEIDASADAADQRTVRLGALIILEAALGYSLR